LNLADCSETGPASSDCDDDGDVQVEEILNSASDSQICTHNDTDESDLPGDWTKP